MGKKLPRKIKASRELQGKVGMGPIDEKKVLAAQKVIDNNEVDFSQLARPELDVLQRVVAGAKTDRNYDDVLMAELKTPIMNLKANAGTFNYAFVSELTGTVLMFFENVEKPDKKIVQIADILHKTILLALAYQMKGDGGAAGKALLETFQDVCSKYKPATS